MKKTRHEDDEGEISVALDNFDDLNRAIQEAQNEREEEEKEINIR